MKKDDLIGLICLAVGPILIGIGSILNSFAIGNLQQRVDRLEETVINVYEIPTDTDATTEETTVVNPTITDATVSDATITDATVTDATVTDTTATDASELDATVSNATATDTTTLEMDLFTTQEVENNVANGSEPSTLENSIEDIPNPTTTEEPKFQSPAISDYEFSLLCQVVECETHGADRESKAHIVHVIRNRIYRREWGSTWSTVILEPNQFGRRSDVTQSTIDAVNYALETEDTTYGCIAFHSGGWCATFFGYRYVFTDSVGHKFYI